MFIEVIKHTPIYVWLLLAFLIQRGIAASQERAAGVLKALLIPGIFILWGLYNIAANFAHMYVSFLTYALFMCFGFYLGSKLYEKNYRFFTRNGVVFREKTYLPLYLILVNFAIKYALNIYMYIHTEAVNQLSFNVLYTWVSGTTVGLFFGGLLVTYRYVTKRRGRLWGER